MSQSTSPKLKQLSPDRIVPNPENPRLVFRQEEMESLMVSIAKYGVQVPIAVFQDGTNTYLLMAKGAGDAPGSSTLALCRR